MAAKKGRKKAHKKTSKKRKARAKSKKHHKGTGVIPPKEVLRRVRKLYNNKKNPAWRSAMNAVVK